MSNKRVVVSIRNLELLMRIGIHGHEQGKPQPVRVNVWLTGEFEAGADRLENAIDYEAVDSQPVDLVFMLLAPENAGADHLKALARVSRLLRDKAICEKLRAAKSPEALYSILTGDKNGTATAA